MYTLRQQYSQTQDGSLQVDRDNKDRVSAQLGWECLSSGAGHIRMIVFLLLKPFAALCHNSQAACSESMHLEYTSCQWWKKRLIS